MGWQADYHSILLSRFPFPYPIESWWIIELIPFEMKRDFCFHFLGGGKSWKSLSQVRFRSQLYFLWVLLSSLLFRSFITTFRSSSLHWIHNNVYLNYSNWTCFSDQIFAEGKKYEKNCFFQSVKPVQWSKFYQIWWKKQMNHKLTDNGNWYFTTFTF